MNKTLENLTGLFLLIILTLFGIVACNGNESDSEPVAAVANVEIFVFPGNTEKRLISEEKIVQNNCDGVSETSQTVTRQQTVQYTMEVGAGLTVSAEGKVGVPSVGEVGVGAEVASHYSVGYGRQEAVSRSVTVATTAGSHIQHTIQQFEIWETGELLIVAGSHNQQLPYSFRRDFSIDIVPPASLGCPPSGSTEQATSPEEVAVDEPIEEPPTATPTIDPPTSIPPTDISPTPIRPINTSEACPNFVTQTVISSWRRGKQTTTDSVQQLVDQFNSYRPTDASGKIYANQQIPADVVIAIGFPIPYSSYPVEALVYYSNEDGNSDKWGLFLTTAEFAAPGDTACLSISN